MQSVRDTIVATATPSGRGAIGIVRLSGPAVRAIAEGMLGRVPPPRRALHTTFRNAAGAPLDDGIALFFPAPASFTGEDVLELQGHGGPVVLDGLVAAALELGARPARAGEFSERAFLNDRLDLVQAEAIADLIESGSAQAARAAVRSLQGAFSNRVHALVEDLIGLRTHLEAAIDFPEEEIDFLADPLLVERLQGLGEQLQATVAAAHRGRLLRDGMSVVLAGRPNAGKSSLLNALAGRTAAIVTEVPGTTRDVLREYIQLDGMPLHIIDTAGLRPAEDAVERIGIERAWEAIAQADRVLLVIDDTLGFMPADGELLAALPPGVPVTQLYNKADASGGAVGLRQAEPPCLGVSAHTGAGLEDLARHLRQSMGYGGEEEGEFTARRRHLEALRQCQRHLQDAGLRLAEGAGELAAEELRLGQEQLAQLTGSFTSDDLLGRIFSSFCIGK